MLASRASKKVPLREATEAEILRRARFRGPFAARLEGPAIPLTNRARRALEPHSEATRSEG